MLTTLRWYLKTKYLVVAKDLKVHNVFSLRKIFSGAEIYYSFHYKKNK